MKISAYTYSYVFVQSGNSQGGWMLDHYSAHAQVNLHKKSARNSISCIKQLQKLILENVCDFGKLPGAAKLPVGNFLHEDTIKLGFSEFLRPEVAPTEPQSCWSEHGYLVSVLFLIHNFIHRTDVHIVQISRQSWRCSSWIWNGTSELCPMWDIYGPPRNFVTNVTWEKMLFWRRVIFCKLSQM